MQKFVENLHDRDPVSEAEPDMTMFHIAPSRVNMKYENYTWLAHHKVCNLFNTASDEHIHCNGYRPLDPDCD